MKKILILLLAAGLVLAMVSTGSAKKTTGHYSDTEFYHEQTFLLADPDLAGPACYYGEDVRVIYRATNTWTWIRYGESIEESDVRENLVQNGTAEIYSVNTGELLDTRPFHCIEKFFDAGGDNSTFLYGCWYTATDPVGVGTVHSCWGPNLEQWQYIWKIAGVYEFRGWNRNGNISWGWKSGDCEGGDGFPPHPPNPHGK